MSEKRIALVTGASRGIGAAIAVGLGERGFVVIGTATSDSGAEKISEKFAKLGIEGRGMALDVCQTDAGVSLVNDITSQYGPVAVLVNNAGITSDNLLMRMSEDEWFGVMRTNLDAIYRLSKACLRGMTKARWGRIISITSVVGSMGNAGQCNYAASKAGVEGFSRSLAKEIGSRNITVNCIAPGFIETDMTKGLADSQRSALLHGIALARLGQPEEIAEVAAFLCTDGAGYITGETIHVNGGLYMA